jgi:hypothetical protein
VVRGTNVAAVRPIIPREVSGIKFKGVFGPPRLNFPDPSVPRWVNFLSH